MNAAFLLADVASELALFAAAGFLLFALDDLVVDLIYFGRRLWRSIAVYSRYPRAFARSITPLWTPQPMAVFVPAWDESAIIGPMLRSALRRFEHPDYRIFVGHYRNDPATAAAIAAVRDERIVPVLVDCDGPTTKADCLNHLYGIMSQMHQAGVRLGERASPCRRWPGSRARRWFGAPSGSLCAFAFQ